MGKVIWTTHLRERMVQRGLNPDWVDSAVRYPDEVQASSTTNSHKHIKYIQGYKIVAAVKRQGSDWVITSAWWNQVYGNTGHSVDHRSILEKLIDSFLKKLEKVIFKKKKN